MISPRTLMVIAFALGIPACTTAAPAPRAPSSVATEAHPGAIAFPVIKKTDPQPSAKRVPPAPVPTVTRNGTRYRAPHFAHDAAGMTHSGGYVEAVDDETGRGVWLKEIYRYVVDPALEGDVQDVFITGLRLEGSALTITDERGAVYSLPLAP